MARVDASDLFFAVAGPYYGSEYEGTSMCEEEFRRAQAQGKAIFVFIQNGGEIEERQAAFIRTLERGYFHSAPFQTVEGLQLQIERTLWARAGASVWSEASRRRAGEVMEEQAHALAGGSRRPSLIVLGYPACSIEELIQSSMTSVDELGRSPSWLRFVGGRKPGHPLLTTATVGNQGYDLVYNEGGVRGVSRARLDWDGTVALCTPSVIDMWNVGKRSLEIPETVAEADIVSAYPQGIQGAVWAALSMIASWWTSQPSVGGQALVRCVITDSEKMDLFRGEDLRRLGFLGPLPQGASEGYYVRPPGVATISRSTWSSVEQVVSRPEQVARDVVAKVWEAFHYPTVSNWVPELAE